MSNHQKVWGTEKFLLGLALSVILFIALWAYVYSMNGDSLPMPN
ncbi:hypothetical protein [Saprospira grandis]|nr:hypothetical protein [Saprospira grandis]WBM76320.1 hypothetical protein OP864_16875 [Saprospira grandis]